MHCVHTIGLKAFIYKSKLCLHKVELLELEPFWWKDLRSSFVDPHAQFV